MSRQRQSPQREDAFPVLRSEVPTASDEPPYRYKPSEADVARFLEYVRQTAQPETFPTICLTKPQATSRPIFLRKFSVERRKRPDGDNVPCPICSPNDPKYLHGAYLAWYPDEGVIRAIGPECGDTVFGGTAYAEAKSTFNLEERERLAVDFLQKNLPSLLSMVVALQAVRPAIMEAAYLYNEFKAKAPKVHEKLRRIRGTSGLLEASIAVEHAHRAPGSSATVTEVLGRLSDASILNSKLNLLRDFQQLEAMVMAMPHLIDEEAAYLWACDLDKIEQLEKAEATLRMCSRVYIKMVGDLERFTLFFSEPLFRTLDEWGRQEVNEFELSASAQGGAFSLRHRYITRHGRTAVEILSLRPNLATLSTARGDWPGFR